MSLRSLFDVDSEQRTAVTHAVAAGFVALATVLLLATTERVFGLPVTG